MSITFEYTPLAQTSESFDFELFMIQIIELAYGKVGALADGEILTPEQVTYAKLRLNMMIKNWRAGGVQLWNNEWITVPITPSSVVLGSDVFDYECIRPHDSNPNNKPVSGRQYTSFWKKLSTSTGSPWADDTPFASAGGQFLASSVMDIDNARLRRGESTQWLKSISQNDYFNIAGTQSVGTPTQYWFRKKRIPEIYFYPFPDSTTDYTIELMVMTYPEDFDNANDYADFLQEWFEPLVDGLAVRLATKEGIFGSEYKTLKLEAQESRDEARKADHEIGDIFVKPDFRTR